MQHFWKSPAQDQLLGAMVGVVRAVDKNGDTPDTLSMLLSCMEISDEQVPHAVEQLHREKDRIAPDCAVCQKPCGSTFDAQPESFCFGAVTQRAQVLAGLEQVARQPETRISKHKNTFYKALFALGEPWSGAEYDAVLAELTEMEKRKEA